MALSEIDEAQLVAVVEAAVTRTPSLVPAITIARALCRFYHADPECYCRGRPSACIAVQVWAREAAYIQAALEAAGMLRA
jgi:hypothetical protein